MIEKIELTNFVNQNENEKFANLFTVVNQLVDAVNKLETMAKNTNTVLESLVQENNIHEMQIDELQMKVEPEKCDPVENIYTKTCCMDKEFAEEELDRTRKALDVAVDALKENQRWFGVIRISMISHLNNENDTILQHYDTDPTVINIDKAKVLLNKALEQIQDITKGGKDESTIRRIV